MGMRPIVTTEVGKGPSQNHSGLKLKSRDRSKEREKMMLDYAGLN